MLAPFASEQLVVLLLDRCHCRLEGLLVEAIPDQHSEDRGGPGCGWGLLAAPAREKISDPGSGELDLRADKIHRLPKQLVFLHFLLAEAGSFPSSLVAYAKRWSRDSGRSTGSAFWDSGMSSIHGLEYIYSRMRQPYS